jgi:hypothetical protein
VVRNAPSDLVLALSADVDAGDYYLRVVQDIGTGLTCQGFP